MSVTPSTPTRPLPFGLDELLDRAKDDHDEDRAVIIALFGEALRDDSAYGNSKEAVCEQAAKIIADLFPAEGYIDNVDRNDDDALQITENATWHFVNQLWFSLLDTCKRVPHNLEHPGHATLLGILEALMEKQKGRGTVQHDWNEMGLWEDLPVFQYTLDYKWAGPSGLELEEQEQVQVDGNGGVDVEARIARWRNGAAFLARGHYGSFPLAWEFTHKSGMPYLCRALEGGKPANSQHKEGFVDEYMHDGLFDSDPPPPDLWADGTVLTVYQRFNIMIATSWITYGANDLYRDSLFNDRYRKKSKDGPMPTEYPAGRLLLEKYPEAEAGLSEARWIFWKERLNTLLNPAPLRSRDMAVAEDVLDAVRLAVSKMEQVEKDQIWTKRLCDEYKDKGQKGAEENEGGEDNTHQ